ncbi:hypothetical protein ACEPPN_015194 [Leptodophora sp. 'Broadleaf-Isolate-01']
MPDYTSPAATDKSDFIANPDFCTFKTDITGGRHSSADHLVEKVGVIKATSIEISSESCQHSDYPLIEGFKIISTKGPDILEIQFYDEALLGLDGLSFFVLVTGFDCSGLALKDMTEPSAW